MATTKIDQVFHNSNDWVAQGTYVFPIPDGATIDNFVMFVDGEPIEAKILSADEARQIYDDIVRRMRDPALLEYVGRGAIQASVFPIPPGEDRRITIEYREVLTADAGLIRYVYPLNTERFSATPLEQVSVHVSVESADPVRVVYSPTHEIAIDRQDDRRFSAGWEDSNVTPNTDFELIYTVSSETIGANLLSYWDPTAQAGTFLLLAAPGIDAAQATIAKDVIVVLDTSGSMEGEKFEQAKVALTYVLEHLNPEDRFNIVEFSTGVRIYAGDLQPASAAPDAVSWVNSLVASGGTDINRALLEGMAMTKPERPTYVLFLTDGLPTEGEVDVPAILNNIRQAAPDNVRLFAFGVGDDVDTILLDTLVQDHHGASSYVRPGERLDEVVSAFYARVSTPLLTDVTLQVEGVTVEEVYPQPLPDIFAGTQLVVVGTYRTGGPAKLILSGQVNGQPQTYVYEDRSFRTEGGDEFLPRLWATRKIGYLLNQIRLSGENPEWVQAIVDLSVRYRPRLLIALDPRGERVTEGRVAHRRPGVVEGEEPEAVRRVDDGGEVLLLRDLVLEPALHAERIQEVVDLVVGEGEHSRFLPTVQVELEVLGVRALGPARIARRELHALVVVVLVRRAGGEGAFLAIGEHGRARARSLGARCGEERGARVVGSRGLLDDRRPEVRRHERHEERVRARTPGRKTRLRVEVHANGQVVDRLDAGHDVDVDVVLPRTDELEVDGRLPREDEVRRGDRLTVGPQQAVAQRELAVPGIALLDRRLELTIGEIRHELDAGHLDRVRGGQHRAQEVAVPDGVAVRVDAVPLVVSGDVLEDAQGIGLEGPTGCLRLAWSLGLGRRLGLVGLRGLVVAGRLGRRTARRQHDGEHGHESHEAHPQRPLARSYHVIILFGLPLNEIVRRTACSASSREHRSASLPTAFGHGRRLARSRAVTSWSSDCRAKGVRPPVLHLPENELSSGLRGLYPHWEAASPSLDPSLAGSSLSASLRSGALPGPNVSRCAVAVARRETPCEGQGLPLPSRIPPLICE